MTTIAYKDGVMCADSLVNSNGCRIAYVTKILKHDGWLFGASGTLADHQAFLRWAVTDRTDDPPQMHEDTACIMCQGTTVRAFERGKWDELNMPFYAIGSGAVYAMGAMQCGASAGQALAASVALDCYSGGEITELRL
jgi:hypothetical protein